MKNYTIILILSINLGAYSERCPYQAVTAVPVADLVGQPLSAPLHYSSLPICGKSSNSSCPRIFQVLLHEQIIILDELGDEVKIKIPHAFYKTTTSNELCDVYWSLKKNFIPIKSLNKKNLPTTISYKTTKKELPFCREFILVEPFYETTFRCALSAGTRFVQAEEPTKKHIPVYALSPLRKKVQKILLPKELCMEYEPTVLPEQARKKFVTLIKKWAHPLRGFIPYVWGGCSFTTLSTHDHFSVHRGRNYKGELITFFYRPDYHRTNPFSGLDCTGLILRAAQMVGMPYYLKNTTTLANDLESIPNAKNIQEGDLIWFPGHVLTVADLNRNTIIEARAYSHGYGKIHELPLKKVFKNIETFDQLFNAQTQKIPLERLAADNSVAQTISDFKILDLISVYN
jgi:hypothetical protein